MKNIIKVIMVIIGTLIGAGFASGREIYIFFTRYGNIGKIGILLSSLLTGVIIYKTLTFINNYKVKDYNNLLEILNPKNEKLNMYISIIVNIFLLISFYIMVAAFCAYMYQSFNTPCFISSIFFILICYLVFTKSLDGVMKISELLVPILILFIIFLSIKNIPYLVSNYGYNYNEINKSWLISSIFYCSYNSIVLIPVLCTMKDCIENKKSIFLISILSVIIIIILAFSIYGLLYRGIYYIENLELPLMQVVLEFGYIFKYLYGFIIIVSILTSAISTGYGFLKNVSKNDKMYKKILIGMCLSALVVSSIGFSRLVEILYPFFGFLGLIQILFIYLKKM